MELPNAELDAIPPGCVMIGNEVNAYAGMAVGSRRHETKDARMWYCAPPCGRVTFLIDDK